MQFWYCFLCLSCPGSKCYFSSEEKNNRERKCKVICSDPVSTSPGRKCPAFGNINVSILPRPPIHHYRQALGNSSRPPSLPLMTLSIRCLALASLLTIMKIFFQPSQTASAPSKLSRPGETVRDQESITFFVEDAHAEGPDPGPDIATGAPQGSSVTWSSGPHSSLNS